MEFWPLTFTGWLSLFAPIATLIGGMLAVIKYVRKPLEDEITRQRAHVDDHFRSTGERVGKVEVSCASNTARVEQVDREGERLHLQFTSMVERQGRLDSQQASLLETLSRYHEQRLTEDRFLGERLARIESRLEIPPVR